MFVQLDVLSVRGIEELILVCIEGDRAMYHCCDRPILLGRTGTLLGAIRWGRSFLAVTGILRGMSTTIWSIAKSRRAV
jgi:hypothetical protein